MDKVTTFLWFDDQAEQAATFYTSLFEDSEILEVARYGDAGPGASGGVITVGFRIGGQRFMALNGGPHFRFNEAISLFVDCPDQAEVDRLWSALTDSGTEGRCGWLKDRWGLSWQVIPTVLPQLLTDPDPGRRERAMNAMLGMNKIEIAALKAAVEAVPA